MAFPTAPEDWEDDEDLSEAPVRATPEAQRELSRLEYLRLLIEGYRAVGKQAPREVLDEYNPLATAEAEERAAKLLAAQAAEKKQMEEWEAQRGRRFARAAGWWSKQEQPPWEAEEVEETEEERKEAIRQAKNLAAARKQGQGYTGQHRQHGLKKGAWAQPSNPKPKPLNKQQFKPLTDEEPF